MIKSRAIIYSNLVYLHPYKGWDCAQYWELAKDMMDNEDHPAFRFFDADFKQKYNHAINRCKQEVK